ncbi:SURF1 family protein [Lentilitoribacter sp. Alg239-R112]|jgi:surfeit locus 1 family protein|uniref:SURF1 family protein n=1 Tax=Lentilitoribacter sp. Alg239-R112 TaxID=2305987 RepID=UPI0013A6AB1F|nr:SURF1 family protein [Lentilitoribacter sp. Alg239-R112]
MEQQKIQKFSIANLLILTLTIIVFATLIVLGTWQVNRLEWKENLLSQIDERLKSQPVTIDQIIENVKDEKAFEYQPVTVEGVFDHSKEQHFFATHQGRTGYYVYTPLSFEGGTVFINRGFVEFDLKNPELRPQGQITGRVSVTGLARKMLNEKPSSLVPDNDPVKNIFYWKDLILMAKMSELTIADDQVQPFFIDAVKSDIPGGYPIGGVTLIDLPNNHLSYAFTWYGLAATLLVIAGVFLFRRKTLKA